MIWFFYAGIVICGAAGIHVFSKFRQRLEGTYRTGQRGLAAAALIKFPAMKRNSYPWLKEMDEAGT